MKPFVGLPSAPGTVGCDFAADLDQPGCGQPVTVHVVGRAEGWGWVALSSCDDHESIAVAGCAELGDIHPAEGCSGEHRAPAEADRD